MRKELKIKEWFIDKEQDKASRYNIFIDYARRTNDVCRQPGEVLGSTKGWTLWIPKSVVIN